MNVFAWKAGALALLGFGLGGCLETATYGTGEAPEMSVFREMSGGLGAGEAEPIEYRPRSPLVVPPSADALPPPQEKVEAALATPDWPKDPGQDHTTQEEKVEALKALTRERAKNRNLVAEMAEMNDNGVSRIPNAEQEKRASESFREALSGYKGGGTAGERRFLTDPPTEYRAPSGAAADGSAAPAEVAAATPAPAPAEKKGFFTRMFGGE